MNAKTTAKDRINPEMGKRLKSVRESKGVTQKDMAQNLGMTVQAYQHYEYGKEISSGRIIQICAILECSPNWLLGVNNTGMHLEPDSLLLHQLREALDESDDGAHLAEDSLLLHQLREAFDQLNEVGQQKVTEYAQILSKLPEYTGQVKNGGSSDAQEVAK